MKCYLIRHGATQGNQEGRYTGSTDEAVLPVCLEQMKSLKSMLNPVDHVFTSPYLRCRQSGEALFSGSGIVSECVWDFREMDFGEFEYKNYRELNGSPAYQNYIDSGGAIAFPGGEEPAHFKARCRLAFLSCISKARVQGFETLGFMLHGGTIMAVMEAFAEPRRDCFSYQVKNGCGYEVKAAWEPELRLRIKRIIKL
ncbi:MAG: histidine phosphatase family protein [Lachnospiraceae bacterium]|nr:histidine phosphatase family protein [Lachnospiraceae bacterium]